MRISTLEKELKFTCKGTFKLLGSYIFLGRGDNSYELEGKKLIV